jgi:predicted anti-sigma-YlaC factor YlaD
MKMDSHERFQRMVDESLAGVITAEDEQSLREHLSTCVPCQQYLGASHRVLSGLGGFSFEVNPNLNAKVLAALTQKAQQGSHTLTFKIWAAFAVALSLSIVGSALVYRMATRLAVPMHFAMTQVQIGVLVFWLLPSFCAAFCLLAAHGQKRGIA